MSINADYNFDQMLSIVFLSQLSSIICYKISQVQVERAQRTVQLLFFIDQFFLWTRNNYLSHISLYVRIYRSKGKHKLFHVEIHIVY